MVYTKKDYNFIKFEKSNRKNNKYIAILKNKKTNKIVKVYFGNPNYQQYRDTTGLKLFSDKDHYDTKRQNSFKARFKHHNLTDWTPSHFSWTRLWSLKVP